MPRLNLLYASTLECYQSTCNVESFHTPHFPLRTTIQRPLSSLSHFFRFLPSLWLCPNRVFRAQTMTAELQRKSRPIVSRLPVQLFLLIIKMLSVDKPQGLVKRLPVPPFPDPLIELLPCTLRRIGIQHFVPSLYCDRAGRHPDCAKPCHVIFSETTEEDSGADSDGIF